MHTHSHSRMHTHSLTHSLTHTVTHTHTDSRGSHLSRRREGGAPHTLTHLHTDLCTLSQPHPPPQQAPTRRGLLRGTPTGTPTHPGNPTHRHRERDQCGGGRGCGVRGQPGFGANGERLSHPLSCCLQGGGCRGAHSGVRCPRAPGATGHMPGI